VGRGLIANRFCGDKSQEIEGAHRSAVAFGMFAAYLVIRVGGVRPLLDHLTPVNFRLRFFKTIQRVRAAGVEETPHGVIETPVFMPVARRRPVRA